MRIDQCCLPCCGRADNGLGPAMDACKKVVRALCGKNPVLDARDAMLELQARFAPCQGTAG